ncbi:MAG TPA: GntR family transcriptional regulator [Burkholderiales bacterium]|nr:GntR family transcriptional regulator [Burkholderiales bacterium]
MKASAKDGDRLAEAVYERVKADIFEFRLLPGARFSENEIAARARVSRTPVREALLRLQREGFLEVHSKSGWRLRPLDFERFEHLYDARIVLELDAVRKLCGTQPHDSLAPLKKAWLVAPKQRLSGWIEVAQLDEAFHATLVEAAGNPELARMHADVTERIRIVRRLDFTQAERIQYTYDEHAAILRAILARKAQQATLLLRSHIEQSKLEVRKISIHRLHVAHLEAGPRNR